MAAVTIHLSGVNIPDLTINYFSHRDTCTFSLHNSTYDVSPGAPKPQVFLVTHISMCLSTNEKAIYYDKKAAIKVPDPSSAIPAYWVLCVLGNVKHRLIQFLSAAKVAIIINLVKNSI